MEINRREFVKDCAVAAGAALTVHAAPPQRILIRSAAEPGFRRKLAERELMRLLSRLLPQAEVKLAAGDAKPAPNQIAFALRIENGRFKDPEGYSIRTNKGEVILAAANEQALLYAVFDFLERQGVFFGIDGESYPLEASRSLVLPEANTVWEASPRFAVRGLLPWPDFLNCITVYNDEDFRAYFESMLRMRFNTFGMHVYTGAEQWAESYLSFEFAGAGHLAYLDSTASNRWGYLPERTSRFTMGGSQFYAGEVFGSDATHGRDPWETAEHTRALLRSGFAHANRLGIRTGIGFEPYQIPDEILRALPPEARLAEKGPGPRFDIESITARDLLETRLAQLLEAYPEVEYVWLWEDESMNWESRKTGLPFSVTPFRQAHDFLRRHAPKKKLVLGGWGGVARHFEHFHRNLPGDVIFTCLSDSLGWDPVNEVFGKLEGRERWPIPWLEDDPGMWLTQLNVHRFESDMNRAVAMGCQGLLGIHWRHRIVDPTAGFQSRFSWDAGLKPADYYRRYARTQAAGARGDRLGEILTAADKDLKLLCTYSGEFKDGHSLPHEFSGDYGEAFTYWADYAPKPAVVESQKQVAAALRQIAGEANSDFEKERVEYLTRHVEFLVPYTEAWLLAQSLHAVLKAASEAKKAGQVEEAREKVRTEGVPLWLKLAPEVRAAMLHFQRIVATRNDLGTLASKHNKFVRLALVRLRLSMKEYLGELPPETETLFAQSTRPDPQAPARLVVPTRPTLLGKADKVRVMAIVAGPSEPKTVTLHTRVCGAEAWTATPAKLLGRRTYQAFLSAGPTGEYLEYYFSAETGGQRLVAPADAPKQVYTATQA